MPLVNWQRLQETDSYLSTCWEFCFRFGFRFWSLSFVPQIAVCSLGCTLTDGHTAILDELLKVLRESTIDEMQKNPHLQLFTTSCSLRFSPGLDIFSLHQKQGSFPFYIRYIYTETGKHLLINLWKIRMGPITIIGSSRVRAPAQHSGHYTRHYFSSSSSLLWAFCSEQTWSLIGWWLQRQASSLAAGS